MNDRKELWIVSVILHEGTIYLWLATGKPREIPGTARALDHLTQRPDEAMEDFFRRVNDFARSESKRLGAKVSITLEPEAPATAN